MGEEKAAGFYDHYYDSMDIDYRHMDGIYKRVAEMTKGEGVLELGCGEGPLVPYLEVGIYKGVDFSQVAVDTCREKYPENTFSCEDLYRFNFNSGYHTVIVALEVFEHIRWWEIFEGIPQGTRIVFSVPSYDSAGHLEFYPDLDHLLFHFKPYIQDMKVIIAKNEHMDKEIYLCDGLIS